MNEYRISMDGVLVYTIHRELNRPKPSDMENVHTLHGRVLIVEDDLDHRRLFSTILEQAGLLVDTAEDGQIACEKAQASKSGENPYDLDPNGYSDAGDGRH